MRRLLTRFAVMHARYRRFPFGSERSWKTSGMEQKVSSRKVSVRVRVATWKPVISSGDIVWILDWGGPRRATFLRAARL